MVHLVVGLDGQTPSSRAIEWAAAAAGTDGTLDAVAATSPRPHLPVADAGPLGDVELRRAVARALDDEWCQPVRERVGRLRTEAVDGDAVDALLDVAGRTRAAAVVVGEHRSATSRHRRVGGTVRGLLDRLEHPLIVVPSSVDLEQAATGAVIVGIGRGDATHAAVGWAARWAEEHQAPLGLVRATTDAPTLGVEGLLDVVAFYIDPAQRIEWIHEDLAAVAAAAQAGTQSELDIALAAPRGRPAPALVESAATAALLVIGHHRGRDGAPRITRPLRHALTHAACPVAVIPPDRRTQS